MTTQSTGPDARPRPPAGDELCDVSRCALTAEWAFAVMGAHPRATARAIFCDEDASFYLRQGEAIYPASMRESEATR